MQCFRHSWFLLFLIIGFTSSCSAEDEEGYVIKPDKNENRDTIVNNEKTVFNILIIGDSFSRDAFSYVPSVMEDVFPGINIDMEILYIGGRALNYHYDYLSNNKKQFVLDQYLSSLGHWLSSYNASGEEAIRAKEWDVVILQEGSNTTRSYEKTQPHIQNLSKYIHLIQDDVPIAFMLSPAKPEGSSALGNYTSDEVWYMNVTTTSQLLENGDVEWIIPCGTSIQNARQTSLDKYGDFGHLSYDSNHLQEGLPCLIEAYTAAQTLFNLFEVDKSIKNSKLKVTQDWVLKKRIPGRHGEVIEGNEDDYELCKKSALLAVENPFVISSPSY
jgi:hypothetical protein